MADLDLLYGWARGQPQRGRDVVVGISGGRDFHDFIGSENLFGMCERIV